MNATLDPDPELIERTTRSGAEPGRRGSASSGYGSSPQGITGRWVVAAELLPPFGPSAYP